MPRKLGREDLVSLVTRFANVLHLALLEAGCTQSWREAAFTLPLTSADHWRYGGRGSQHTRITALGQHHSGWDLRELRGMKLSSRLTVVLHPCETEVRKGGSNFSKGGGAAPTPIGSQPHSPLEVHQGELRVWDQPVGYFPELSPSLLYPQANHPTNYWEGRGRGPQVALGRTFCSKWGQHFGR